MSSYGDNNRQLLALPGTAAVPGFSFLNATKTGMYLPAANTIALSANGTERIRINSSGVTIGLAGTTAGTLLLSGGTSGTTTLAVAAVASGTITFPATTGTVTVLGNTSTGSGSVVLATSPTLVTPTLGVASATSINKVTITAPATSSTLTIADGKTLTVSNSLSFSGTDSTVMTFPSSTDTVAGIAASQTLTNKRIDPRFTSTTSASTLSPDISAKDMYMFTALAAALTINAPTGTPVDGDKLIFRIKDNGTAQTLTWNAIYRTVGVGTLPTTTTAGKIVYFGCIYNSAETLWDVVALSQQA